MVIMSDLSPTPSPGDGAESQETTSEAREHKPRGSYPRKHEEKEQGEKPTLAKKHSRIFWRSQIKQQGEKKKKKKG